MGAFWSLLRRWRWKGRYYPILVLLILLLVWPAIMLLIGGFRSAPPGSPADWTVQAIPALLAKAELFQAIFNSFKLAVSATLPALILAILFAWLSQRTTMTLRRVITPAMMLVFAMPSLFYALAFDLFANRYNGYANSLINLLGGSQIFQVDAESWSGLIGVTFLRATAFIYLFIAPAFRGLDIAHEDASLTCGRGRLATFLLISLPMLTPAITGAVILSFVAGLHSFDTPLILGEPVGIRVIATEIYDMLVNSYPPAYAEASLLSVALVVFVALLCIVQSFIMGRRGYITVTGKRTTQPLLPLGKWAWAANTLVILFLLLAIVAPFLSLIYGALQPYPGVYGQISLMHFGRVFTQPGIWQAIITTLKLSVTVGAAAMVLAVMLCLTSRHFSPRIRSVVRFSTLLPYAMPGIVAALSVTWAWLSLPGLKLLYGTVWMMMLAFIVVVMPFAMQAANAVTSQLSHELGEAARIAGASMLQSVFQITGPLILPGFLVGWFFIAIIIAGNLDIPLLLGSPTLSTIASQTYLLQSQGQTGDAAALLICTLLLLIAVALIGAGIKFVWRRRHARLRQQPAPVSSVLRPQESEYS